jgi:hypothetical protein
MARIHVEGLLHTSAAIGSVNSERRLTEVTELHSGIILKYFRVCSCVVCVAAVYCVYGGSKWFGVDFIVF